MLVQPNSASAVKTVIGTTGVPLSLAYLGAALREEHKIRIIDALTLDYGTEELKGELKKHEPDVVGITATTPAIYGAYDVAKLVKEFNLDVKTVIGGPHATFTANGTLDECPELDVVVRHEGERTFKELADAFENGTPLKKYRGDMLQRERRNKRDRGQTVHKESR